MKLAVILGVTQMSLGVLIKGANCIYFGKAVDFFFEFIPQLLFLSSTFGYMIMTIFIKWSIDYTGKTAESPSLLTLMMSFGL